MFFVREKIFPSISQELLGTSAFLERFVFLECPEYESHALEAGADPTSRKQATIPTSYQKKVCLSGFPEFMFFDLLWIPYIFTDVRHRNSNGGASCVGTLRKLVSEPQCPYRSSGR